MLSHFAAGALWGIRPSRSDRGIDPFRHRPTPPGHQDPSASEPDRGEITTHDGIPVTSPTCTIVDLAARLPSVELERAINQADTIDVIHVAELRETLDDMARACRALRVVKRP